MLGVFWQGFATAFLVTFGILWAKPYFDNYDMRGNKKSDDPKLERPLLERLAISIPAMAGILGAIFSFGALCFSLSVKRSGNDSVSIALSIPQSGNDPEYWMFLLGFPVGIAYALLLRRRL